MLPTKYTSHTLNSGDPHSWLQNVKGVTHKIYQAAQTKITTKAKHNIKYKVGFPPLPLKKNTENHYIIDALA